MAQEGKEKKKKWYSGMRNKYRLVFMNDETLEEAVRFRLTPMNLFVALGTIVIVLIFLTTILIAFTPLREYIPGYASVGLQKRLYELQIRTDSIERDLQKKDQYIQNIKNVINGADLPGEKAVPVDTSSKKYNAIHLKKSPEDSLLRIEVENQEKYSLRHKEGKQGSITGRSSLGNVLLFCPLKGVVTNGYNPAIQHYGVDIVAARNEAIKAILDGTVILSTYSVETGYTIVIQHSENILSVYKHNSALLKKAGDIVRAGEAIAIIGQTGELTTGSHLHLEIWYNGSPVDPKNYISF
ncbi:MAG: M23 family metallopeptidase [Bacteroidota bacterium]|nr:M23 family metallopeptidase [Bacteroidota bacterium]